MLDFWGAVQLEIYLGMDTTDANVEHMRGDNQGSQLAGGHWGSPIRDDPSFGSSVFTAIPGGYRSSNGSYFNRHTIAKYWTSSVDGQNVWTRSIWHSHSGIFRLSHDKRYGLSVRCVKDQR